MKLHNINSKTLARASLSMLSIAVLGVTGLAGAAKSYADELTDAPIAVVTADYSSVKLVDPQTGHTTTIAPSQGGVSYGNLSYSTNKQRVAWIENVSGHGQTLEVYNLQTSQLKDMALDNNLTIDTEGSPPQMMWFDNDTSLAFVAVDNETDMASFYTIRANGTNEHQFAQFSFDPIVLYSFAIASNGHHIVFSDFPGVAYITDTGRYGKVYSSDDSYGCGQITLMPTIDAAPTPQPERFGFTCDTAHDGKTYTSLLIAPIGSTARTLYSQQTDQKNYQRLNGYRFSADGTQVALSLTKVARHSECLADTTFQVAKLTTNFAGKVKIVAQDQTKTGQDICKVGAGELPVIAWSLDSSKITYTPISARGVADGSLHITDSKVGSTATTLLPTGSIEDFNW